MRITHVFIHVRASIVTRTCPHTLALQPSAHTSAANDFTFTATGAHHINHPCVAVIDPTVCGEHKSNLCSSCISVRVHGTLALVGTPLFALLKMLRACFILIAHQCILMHGHAREGVVLSRTRAQNGCMHTSVSLFLLCITPNDRCRLVARYFARLLDFRCLLSCLVVHRFSVALQF